MVEINSLFILLLNTKLSEISQFFFTNSNEILFIPPFVHIFGCQASLFPPKRKRMQMQRCEQSQVHYNTRLNFIVAFQLNLHKNLKF